MENQRSGFLYGEAEWAMASRSFLESMKTVWVPTCQQAAQKSINNGGDPRTARPRCIHVIPGNGEIRLRFSEGLNYCKCCGGGARVPSWGKYTSVGFVIHSWRARASAGLCPCCLGVRAAHCPELCPHAASGPFLLALSPFSLSSSVLAEVWRPQFSEPEVLWELECRHHTNNRQKLWPGEKKRHVNLGFTGSLNSEALTVYTVVRGVSIKGNKPLHVKIWNSHWGIFFFWNNCFKKILQAAGTLHGGVYPWYKWISISVTSSFLCGEWIVLVSVSWMLLLLK